MVPYGSLHHIDGEPKECTILDGFQLHRRLIKETIGKHLLGQCGAKTVVKQNKSVVHIPLKEALDVLEGKSGIVVQLLGVSGPPSKKFGLEIFMGERRTTAKFSPILQLFMPNLPKFRQSIESTNTSTGSDPVQGACAHTSCNYIENLKAPVLQLPSVLRLEDATELQFPCTSRHDCVKILKLVLKNRSVPKMAWSLDDSVLGSSYF